MRNTSILAVFLFMASFSFIACSGDDPVNSIVGPDPIGVPTKGDKGDKGNTGPAGKDGVASTMQGPQGPPGDEVEDALEGLHVDFIDEGAGIATICHEGYHIHRDENGNLLIDGFCRDSLSMDYWGYDVNDDDPMGCEKPEYFSSDPNNDGDVTDQGCYHPSTGYRRFFASQYYPYQP